MKIMYFDCFAGISGDMTLGAFIDAGLDLKVLAAELQKLGLKDYSINTANVLKNGIHAVKCNIDIVEKSDHRHYGDIVTIIENSNLSDAVKEISKKIFKYLAASEGKIHDTTMEKVHFHEVGALDSIIDIVGVAIGVEQLGIEKFYCSKIHIGDGFVESQHGTIPVPAPATLDLLKGFSVYSRGISSELVTPTGAAILAALVEDKGKGGFPDMQVHVTGYGAGSRDLPVPNCLRLFVGESTGRNVAEEEIYSIETNIDDMNPELYSYLYELLFKQGALDVFTQPIYMKKNRPATLLTVLSDHDHKQDLLDLLLRETTSAGVRVTVHSRMKKQRSIQQVETVYGTVSVKMIGDAKTGITVSPEYEDCKKVAINHGVPIKDVYAEASMKAYEKFVQ